MLTLEQLFFSVFCGIAAWLFVNILSDIGMIFGKYREWLEESKLPMWFYKISTCSYCLAGQISLWFFALYYINSYDFLQHITFILGSIFTVHIINTKFENF